MHTISEDRYFFVIPKLGFYPEIQTNTVKMLEQVLNAILLSSTDNIEHGLNRILGLEYSCKPTLDFHYVEVLNNIATSLKEEGISIVQGETIRAFYPHIGNDDKYYWDVGVQVPLNLEFALAKKISYNGSELKFEDTYVHWLNKLMMAREEKTSHKPDDRFITHTLFQKVQNLHWDIEQTIRDETVNYVNEYRKVLEARH